MSMAIEKLPCAKCGRLMLPRTALRTGGKCMQCIERRKYSHNDRPRNAIRNCNDFFELRCPMNWNDLEGTDNVGVRFCRECKDRVFFCRTANEALNHAKAGHCVALPGQDGSAAGFGAVVGRPVAPIVLTADQQALVKAEKADRAMTEKIRAATKRPLRKLVAVKR